MATERKNLRDYLDSDMEEMKFVNLTNGLNIAFSPSQLPTDGMRLEQNGRVYISNQDFRKPPSITESRISYYDDVSETVFPIDINYSTRTIVVDPEDAEFAGYGETNFRYVDVPENRTLAQKVSLSKMQDGKWKNTGLEGIVLERSLDLVGYDATVGMLLITKAHAQQFAERLGIDFKGGYEQYICLLPDKVLVTRLRDNEGIEVTDELSYVNLEKAGIVAEFTDGPEQTTLTVAVGDLNVKLQLGKVLKENYPQIMFRRSYGENDIFGGKPSMIHFGPIRTIADEGVKYITDSRIRVTKISPEILN